MIGFLYYLRDTYGRESGTSNSYYRAIQILDEIFRQYDILNLRGQSLASIIDAGEIFAIYEFVKTEELRDFYTNEAAKEYFERYEGKQLELPKKCQPDKNLLKLHREKLIS